MMPSFTLKSESWARRAVRVLLLKFSVPGPTFVRLPRILYIRRNIHKWLLVEQRRAALPRLEGA